MIPTNEKKQVTICTTDNANDAHKYAPRHQKVVLEFNIERSYDRLLTNPLKCSCMRPIIVQFGYF